MNQAQLIENVEALRKQTKGLSWWEKITLGRIVRTMKQRVYTQSQIDEFAKLYRQISDNWHKKTGDKIVVEKKPKVDPMISFIRKKAFEMLNKDLKRAYNEKRIIFDGDKIRYTDKNKVVTHDIPDVIASILFDKYNTTLSNIAGYGQSTLVALGISPDDVKEILLKLENGK